MADKARMYEVSGTDGPGDVHLYRTNDTDRAEGMREMMAEDLENVEMVEQS